MHNSSMESGASVAKKPECRLSDMQNNHSDIAAMLEVEMARTAFTGLETSLLLIKHPGQSDKSGNTGPAPRSRWREAVHDMCTQKLRLIDRHGPLASDTYAVILSSTGMCEASQTARRLFQVLRSKSDQPASTGFFRGQLKFALITHRRTDHPKTPQSLLVRCRKLLDTADDNVRIATAKNPNTAFFQDVGLTVEEKNLLLGRN